MGSERGRKAHGSCVSRIKDKVMGWLTGSVVDVVQGDTLQVGRPVAPRHVPEGSRGGESHLGGEESLCHVSVGSNETG